MAGELNGVKALLLIGDGAGDYSELVGQLELSNNVNGSLIDISHKSLGDYVAYLNGELGGDGLTLSGTLVYNNDATYRLFKAKQDARLITDFKLSFNNEDTTSLYINGLITELSDNLEPGDKIVTSFSIMSTGERFRSQLFVPVGSDSFITSDSKTFRVRI
jgi:hypothetical protein